MKNNEVEKLVKLRMHIIKFYTKLDEKHSPTAVMNTRDASRLCEELVNSLDELLQDYVKFEEKE
ncbi:MAG TPA: hypothetical protein EYG21_06995 [Nitrospinaceae bacterium]|jgi:hypothetical protein|nr:hypothetical protein [Nitrospinaceae bacterium]